MRTTVLAVTLGFLLCLVLFITLATGVTTAAVAGYATDISGGVEVQRRGHGAWTALTPRGAEPARVKVGDRLRTAADGHLELQWADGTRMALQPDTRLEVRKFKFDRSVKGQTSLFKLDLGAVWTRVTHTLEGDSRFEIETPDATAGVRGTIFEVRALPSGTEVEVYEGRVELGLAGGGHQQVAAGATAAVRGAACAAGALSSADRQAVEASDLLLPGLRFNPARLKAGRHGVWVRGVAEPGARVTVAGQPATVGSDGAFAVSVTPPAGAASLEVVATDAAGHRRVADYPLN
jgi:hypothetical protein